MEKELDTTGEKWQFSWTDLPSEIASMILSHLPYQYHITFRATCKSWRLVPSFHGQHQSPLLLLLRKDQYYLFNPIYNTYHMPTQQPPTRKILCSNFGWLLMGASLASDPTIFFYNIFTNVRIDLPDLLSNLFPSTKFIFSCSPTDSKNCFVVGVRIMYTHARIYVTKPGESNWTIVDAIDFTRSSNRFYMSDCNPIFHKGECFILAVKGNVAIFDPKDPEATFRIYNKSFSGKSELRESFLVQSDGELLAVTVSGKEGQHVCLYKLHSSKMEWNWIYVSNLDDKILYLSCNGSWAETTSFGGMGNKIFFPRFRGQHMVFYSLHTKKYHSDEDEFWSNNAYNLSVSMYSTWIKPML